MTVARQAETALAEALAGAGSQPIGVDISDYSDEFCIGFLAGQKNALEELQRALSAVREHGEASDAPCCFHGLSYACRIHGTEGGAVVRPDATTVSEALREVAESFSPDNSRYTIRQRAVLTRVRALAAAVPAAKEPAWACTGDSACTASPHMHGCFADRGDCDQPSEHRAAPVSSLDGPDGEERT